MDPYLEASEIWPGFHQRLAIAIADQLTPRIAPKYYADVNLRTVGETVEIGTTYIAHPDVGVYEKPHAVAPRAHSPTGAALAPPAAPVLRAVLLEDETVLRSVHVYLTGTDVLVTAIEILSPYNKRRSDGLDEYRAKRRRLLHSSSHLIEVDLLRGGERPGPEVLDPPLDSDYVLLVNRQGEDLRRVSEIWPVSLSEPLPTLPVPLVAPDPYVLLDLNDAVHSVYVAAGYSFRIDYARPAPPPELRPAMAAWVKQAVPRGGRTEGA